MDRIPEILPDQLAEMLAAPDTDPTLLDVRSPEEWSLCRLEGAVHIPLHTLPARLDELDRETDLIVYCHHGVRSAMAVQFLAEHGFNRVRNLTGGIDYWSQTVDPELPRYG